MTLFKIAFLEFGIIDLVESMIIAFALYFMYRWVRGTFAIYAGLGLLLVVAINVVMNSIGFTTINRLLSGVLDVGVLAIFILFQPEIRKILYNLGQNTNLESWFGSVSNSAEVIDEVVKAVKNMARTKTGALIVFARTSSLQDMVDVGARLDAKVKAELLETIFNKHTPLHDGAVVIRDNRIVAASCYLPISQNPNISSVFGTRHRAAVGISENNNVFVIVVSEETGRISIARDGSLTSGLTIQKLRAEMVELLEEKEIKTEEVGGFKSATAEKETELKMN
ncbi:MAG: diadenylate cyclase CdaA [Bacteroidota bacterium]